MLRSRSRRNGSSARLYTGFAVAKIAIVKIVGAPDIGAMAMDTPLTAILTVVCLLCAAGSGYMGAKMPDPRRGPRMVPWRFLMLIAVLVGLMLIVHLLTLLGLKHDQPMRF